MSNLAILERKIVSMIGSSDDKEILQILERIEKLSQRPENPGIAYRNLETINALMETLRDRLNQRVRMNG